MFTWFAPDNSNADLTRSASVPQPVSVGPGIEGTATLTREGVFTGTISAHPTMKSGWKLMGVTRPENMESNPVQCPYEYDEIGAVLTIRCDDASQGVIFSATGVFPKLP